MGVEDFLDLLFNWMPFLPVTPLLRTRCRRPRTAAAPPPRPAWAGPCNTTEGAQAITATNGKTFQGLHVMGPLRLSPPPASWRPGARPVSGKLR